MNHITTIIPGETTEFERFTKAYVVDESGCWLWKKACNQKGYGAFYFLGMRGKAHRYSFLKYKGMIPEGLVIDHLCNVRSCVNPDHLRAVTNKENILRGTSPSARNKRKTTCPRQHPLSGTNLVINIDGARVCKTCASNSYKEYWKRKRIALQEAKKEILQEKDVTN